MNWYTLKVIEAARKLPDISYREMAKFLQQMGYQHTSTNSSHEKWSKQTGHSVIIPASSSWGSNSKNKVEYILKNMGINVNAFAQMWQNKKQRKNPSQFLQDPQQRAASYDLSVKKVTE